MAGSAEIKAEARINPENLVSGSGVNGGIVYGWTEAGGRYYWIMDADDLIENRADECPGSEAEADLLALRRVRSTEEAVSLSDLTCYVAATRRAFDWFTGKYYPKYYLDEGTYLLGPSVRNIDGEIVFNHTARGVWVRTEDEMPRSVIGSREKQPRAVISGYTIWN